MENKNIKCSLKKHKDIDAISFCQDCKLSMCKKCLTLHSELFENNNHKINNLNKDIKDFFTGFCNEDKHKDELEYYCKTHNILCCAACLSLIKSKGNGLHKDCKVYNIEEIKDEKKNKLKENNKYLEDLSKKKDQLINKVKEIYEKINKDKEDLKLKIQKIFTKLRNALNEREDEILLEVDNKFDSIYFNEDIIKISEKIPNKLKIFVEKGKLIENEWNKKNVKLSSLINDCINIENFIKDINMIKEKTIRYNSINLEIKLNKKKIM